MSSLSSAAEDTSNAALPSNMDSPEDLDVFVKELMDNMQIRFNRLSDTIVGRIDEMGSKLDELENSLNDLMDQAGVESSDSLVHTAAKGTMKR